MLFSWFLRPQSIDNSDQDDIQTDFDRHTDSLGARAGLGDPDCRPSVGPGLCLCWLGGGLRTWVAHLPSTSATVVLSLGSSDAGVRTLHGVVRGRRRSRGGGSAWNARRGNESSDLESRN